MTKPEKRSEDSIEKARRELTAAAEIAVTHPVSSTNELYPPEEAERHLPSLLTSLG